MNNQRCSTNRCDVIKVDKVDFNRDFYADGANVFDRFDAIGGLICKMRGEK